jgi:alpha-L-fucosidase
MGVSIIEAAKIAPSPRQLAWQQMEFYSFIHFTVNTYTDMEWGFGNEDPAIFNPTEFDAAQWVEVCKSAGMTGLILTCKHHDGFCLWPTDYTDYSVKKSPWNNGQGDMVREVVDACRKGGLKFGVYLSPWDRHEQTYGDSPAYNAYFINQLRELLTNYGDVFCVWFDGACGEGSNGKRQEYDWDAYYSTIRELQPNAVISICGPDVRWCGNEAGHTRPMEWSVVPESMRDNEKIAEKSQQVDDAYFSRKVPTFADDLGSRTILAEADKMIWYPSEVNTSIRPGWFYHSNEDDQVRSVDELVDLYERTVGGNTTFLLNLPPDRRGLIHENDARVMRELGQRLREIYGTNLAEGAAVHESHTMDASHAASCTTDGNPDTYWCALEGTEQADLELDLSSERSFDRIVLQEYIQQGQRIESFRLEWKDGDAWKPFFQGTVVGYKKICKFDEIKARYIRLVITESRVCPTLSLFGVHSSIH